MATGKRAKESRDSSMKLGYETSLITVYFGEVKVSIEHGAEDRAKARAIRDWLMNCPIDV